MRVQIRTVGWSALGLTAVALVLLNAQRSPLSSTTRNPAGEGKAPAVRPLLASVDVVAIGEVMAAVLFLGTVWWLVRGLRRNPRNPVLLMVAASCTLCWFDPINNWAIGLVYNPAMWHFPQDWPWVNMSPVIEPLTSFVYAPYVTLPYFVAMPLLRMLQRRRGPNAFVARRPLLAIGLLTFAIGFMWDAGQEMFLVSTQFLTYSHVVPFGSLWVGQYRQFPLLMASTLITMVMIPVSVLLYREGEEPTTAEKLAQRFRLYARRPVLTTFVLMAAILNVCFISFSTCFFLARISGAATSVACPWPYPEAKVWDPQGRYEANGQKGPFTAGTESTWLIGQPNGRPKHVVVESTRCR